MSGCDERLGATGLPTRRGDPRLCEARESGARERDHPPRPRERRRTGTWLLLLVGIAGVVTGMVLPNGLLLAAGLVLAGAAGQSAGSRASRRSR
ncbi:hypothetical protein SUDANB176_06938 [Streptomyces sp. enrichment culture]|uniref:DUF3040 domain-containing protein n=1 Tax=Streptomyces sp. enrichment culture TaxID=1795815 RepID=UPI003F555A19